MQFTQRGQSSSLPPVGGWIRPIYLERTGTQHAYDSSNFDIATDKLTAVAEHDPDRFAVGAPNFLTQDEESSGVVDVSDILGEGWYLLDIQAHYATDTELVEGGQLIALHVPPGKP